MRESCFCIVPAAPFRLDLTVWTLRRRKENAVDRWDGETYRRVIALPGGPVNVAVTQSGSATAPKLHVTVLSDELGRVVKAEISVILARLLGLNINMGQFYRFAANHPPLHELARRFRGMKPPRFTGMFEGIINAIACQQLTLTVGIGFLNRLATAYGDAVFIERAAVHAFPQPQALAVASPGKLRELGFSHNKSRAIIELAQGIASGQLELDRFEALPDAQALRQLQLLRGVGRWTAEYTLLRGLGRVHIFPGDDVGARNNLQRWLNISEPLDYQGVHKSLGEWHRFGGLVYFHLLLRSLAEAGHIEA